ncbi:multidrug efflux pump subunit AcrB [Litorivivens lipolytica]|uniref:Multidrug efflux pump subunit AcrB n=1 Tax=Litorivivens lipolytica TaxID=1524264 RepID=A0A7W4Z554_9GAMM|nr:efflux RND transporter permease subunit [Litorivivens lipolytica]MBB3046787.1 multidrug efflux pump subunit AcrB [Litorivivens lipolytica]
MSGLIGFFARRPLLVNLLLVMVLLSGFVVLRSLVVSSYPSLDTGVFHVTTLWPGAAATDVELSLTVPLEEEILEIEGLDKLRSASMEGQSSILIQSNPDHSRAQNRQFRDDLQRAIDRAYPRMPDDVPEKPILVAEDPDRTPIMEILIHGNVDEDVLRRVARRLQVDLRQVKGVAGTERLGYRRKEVRILLNPQRLQQLGIDAGEISRAIAARNVRDSGGALESTTSERDVVTVGQFQHPKEVEEVIVRASGRDNFTRIKDIAEVVVDYEDWMTQPLANGVPGISLLVKKTASANGVAVAADVRDFIRQQQALMPPGVTLDIFNDTTRYARNMLEMLSSNALFGMLLVFITLMAFFPFRFTVWVVVGIPTAMMLTFIFMPSFNITVNQLSLSGIILMLGVLVDDAIVIAESIFREAERGKPPLQAAIDGTTVMAAPVLTSSATTVLAFLPLVFLSGIEGKYLWMLPAVVVMVLLSSLIECKLMLPAHIAHALQGRHRDGRSLSRGWFNPVERGYIWIMRHMFRHRVISFLVILMVAAGAAVFSQQKLAFDLYPEGDTDAITVQLELPLGTSFATMRERLAQLERDISAQLKPEDLLATKVTVGHHDLPNMANVTEGRQNSWGLVQIYLERQSVRTSTSSEVVRELEDFMAGQTDFTLARVVPQENTPPTGEAVELDIVGNSDARFLAADEISNFLEGVPGVTRVWTSYKPGKDIIDLQLKHELLANYGLTVQDVTRAVRIAFDGLLVEEMQTIDERVRFRLQYRQPEQGQLSSLYGLTLINNRGEPVLLRSVADFETKSAQATVFHYFGERTLTLFADIDKAVLSVADINSRLENYLHDSNLRSRHSQLNFVLGGEADRQQDAMGNIGSAALLSLAGILVLLVLLFNSVSQPLLVLLVIPLGILGVLVAFALQGMVLSMSALAGVTGLAGILVNDALIMIDQLNRVRGADGKIEAEALVQTASTRLRPIFITTLTTVAGLYPVAYGVFGLNIVVAPLAMVMLWGVVFGSIITLFYLPSLYALEQDVSRLFRRQ